MTEEKRKSRPKVGLAVYIVNDKAQILLMKRKGSHQGTWAPPGGHLEIGESFLECAKRELKEEVGLDLKNIELYAVNNNIFSLDNHYVNLDFKASGVNGEAQNLEPEKCEKIGWFELNALPSPLMFSVENFFKNNPKCLCGSGKKYLECHGK